MCRVNYHLIHLNSGLIEKDVIKADLKWVFEKGNGGNIYNVFQQLPRKTELVNNNLYLHVPNGYFSMLALFSCVLNKALVLCFSVIHTDMITLNSPHYIFLLFIPFQVLPDSIRGAVLGFASRAEENGGALCISFGSPSLGFTDALGRVFSRVRHASLT